MKAKYDWSKVNWEDQDTTIAKLLNCTRERVRQKRLELGVERSPHFHQRTDSALKVIVNLKTDDLKLSDIANTANCSETYVRGVLLEHGKNCIFIDKRKGGKYDWKSADWNKTDKEIAAILGVQNVGVVTGHRRRLGIFKNRVKVIDADKEKTTWSVVEKVNI